MVVLFASYSKPARAEVFLAKGTQLWVEVQVATEASAAAVSLLLVLKRARARTAWTRAHVMVTLSDQSEDE